MEIKTKFNVEDTVYFLHSNKIHRSKIESIRISSCSFGTAIHYRVMIFEKYSDINEKECFASKEELKDSL